MELLSILAVMGDRRGEARRLVSVPPLADIMKKETTHLEKVKDIAGILQSVATIIAIIAAGIWFFCQGIQSPKANVSHMVTHRQIMRELELGACGGNHQEHRTAPYCVEVRKSQDPKNLSPWNEN